MRGRGSLPRLIFHVAGGLLAFISQVAAATITSLPAAPPYNWGTSFGIAGGFVREYRNLDGSVGGAVISFTMDVFDNDPDPNEKDPLVNGMEKIGNLNFQFVLTRESTTAAGPIVGVGAALFGGFLLTDLDDAGTRFSFLQTVNGLAAGGIPNGVDGGGFRGKFNGDIPSYNASPGWNYQGTQYDYLDNPFIPNSLGQTTASFETALTCYTDSKQVHILADFTWSFTSDGMGGITGVSPTAHNAASQSLFDAYFSPTSPPGPSPAGNTPTLMQNIGVGGCHDFAANTTQPPIPQDIAEPNTLVLLGIGLAGIILGTKRYRLRH